MIMTLRLRKLALTAHVTTSVGWLGAVAAFLVLGVVGLTSRDGESVRAAYLAMNVLGEFMIVPLSVAALVTGLIQSFGTHWGLFRHYWVLTKFVLTMGATALLLLHQFTAVAAAAKRVSLVPAGSFPELGGLGTQLVGDAALAVIVLLVTATLSVYKPWGETSYWQRKRQRSDRRELVDERFPASLRIFIAVIGAILVAGALIAHIARGGLASH